MDIFAQKKLLIRIILALVILNIISMSVFLWKDIFRKPPPPREQREQREQDKPSSKDITAILKDELNLSNEQATQIKNLRADFFEKEKTLSQSIRIKRDSMNMLMFNKQTDTLLVQQLAKGISENEYQMEMLRLKQSQQLKNICTPEQTEKLERLVKEIRDYFKPEKK